MKWLSFLMLIVSSLAFADGRDTEIYTLPLKHTTANEILPKIQPFIPENATLQGYQNILILRSDRATWEEVQAILANIDAPLQSLIITVVRGQSGRLVQRAAQDRIDIELGDTNEVNATISRWSTERDNHQAGQYRARGIAGEPVAISLGEDSPQNEHLIFIGPNGVYLRNSVNYISTANGFQAITNVYADQRVKVEIHPFFSKLSGSDRTITKTEALTTLMGELGEWIELGHIAEHAAIDTQGYNRYHSDGDTTESIYLKVETTP
jgi:hypothetical protein